MRISSETIFSRRVDLVDDLAGKQTYGNLLLRGNVYFFANRGLCFCNRDKTVNGIMTIIHIPSAVHPWLKTISVTERLSSPSFALLGYG